MEPIKVEYVGYYGLQIAERHFTKKYELLHTQKDTAIYRRGYTFFLAIGVDRQFVLGTDVIRVIFTFGKVGKDIGSKPKRDITRITLIPKSQDMLPTEPDKWGIRYDRMDDVKYVMVEVRIPANAPVGVWNCSIRTNIKGTPKQFLNFQVPQHFYILFNPWCKEDGVYLENNDDRNEYILNDLGTIWTGTWWNPIARPWIFGQFEDEALRTAILLLDKSRLAPENRGDPVQVTRAISAIINADDDNGLLVANWDGNYSDGTNPYAWTGSKPIMAQYLNSDGAVPVRYGLCWVFSAVTVTICRALGIPCRSTTVYASGQNSNNITRNYSAFGELIEDTPNEAVWSFHAWNDVWISRPRMPDYCSGWQIIDSTPIRRSEGIMRCGPAPVGAVRRGFKDYLYDTDFIYDMLNASITNFAIDEDNEVGEYQLPKNKYQPGKRSITKAIGSDDLWDITDSYKSVDDDTPNNIPISDDVTFKIVVDRVPYGETLNVTVKAFNPSNSTKDIKTVLAAKSVFYTGKLSEVIDRRDDDFTLKAGEARTLPTLSIPASTYIPKLVEQGFIKLYAFAEVKNSSQARWADEEDFIFTPPTMNVSVSKMYYNVGETINVNFSFMNPVNVPLTNCGYIVEGPSDVIPKIVRLKDVQPLDR